MFFFLLKPKFIQSYAFCQCLVFSDSFRNSNTKYYGLEIFSNILTSNLFLTFQSLLPFFNKYLYEIQKSQLLVLGCSLLPSFFSELFSLLSFNVLSVEGWSNRESLNLKLILIYHNTSLFLKNNYAIPFSPQSSPQLFSINQHVCPSLTSQPMSLTA